MIAALFILGVIVAGLVIAAYHRRRAVVDQRRQRHNG